MHARWAYTDVLATEFIGSSRQEIDSIAEFLQTAFQSASDAPYLSRPLMHWKYYEPGPEWNGSRSYVLRDGERLLAHAAVWPLKLQTSRGLESGLSFYDWASSREQPGVGLLLVKKLTELSPFMIVIGGAEVTRLIMPRMGFQQRASLPVYARVLRPWQQYRTRPSGLGWKEPVRIARNSLWRMSRLAPAEGWAAQLIGPEHPLFSTLQEGTDSRLWVRTGDFMRYMLRCPGVAVRCFALVRDGLLQGYFVLNRVAGQSRIAELRLSSQQESDWTSACSVVVRTAMQDPETCELVGMGTSPLINASFESNQFRVRDHWPLFVYDPKAQLTDEAVLQVSMLDGDASFFSNPEYPYLT